MIYVFCCVTSHINWWLFFHSFISVWVCCWIKLSLVLSSVGNTQLLLIHLCIYTCKYWDGYVVFSWYVYTCINKTYCSTTGMKLCFFFKSNVSCFSHKAIWTANGIVGFQGSQTCAFTESERVKGEKNPLFCSGVLRVLTENDQAGVMLWTEGGNKFTAV